MEICEICNKSDTTKNKVGCLQWYGRREGNRYCYQCYHKIVKPSKMKKILCLCGCGELIPILTRTGNTARYKNHHHPISGINHYKWKGGRIKKDGYWRVLNKSHPFTDKQGHIYEHRLVMEKHIGRYLAKNEVVHHINGDKTDNRIENLKIMTRSEHGRHEAIIEWKNRV